MSLASPEMAARVKAALAAESQADVDPAVLTEETTLGGSVLGLESLAFLRALINLEDELDMTMDDELLARTKLTTVGDVLAFVQASAGGAP